MSKIRMVLPTDSAGQFLGNPFNSSFQAYLEISFTWYLLATMQGFQIQHILASKP